MMNLIQHNDIYLLYTVFSRKFLLSKSGNVGLISQMCTGIFFAGNAGMSSQRESSCQLIGVTNWLKKKLPQYQHLIYIQIYVMMSLSWPCCGIFIILQIGLVGVQVVNTLAVAYTCPTHPRYYCRPASVQYHIPPSLKRLKPLIQKIINVKYQFMNCILIFYVKNI